MHRNQEYAEGQDFVIAKTISNLFCILENCFMVCFLENSVTIMSEADAIYANVFGFMQSWN